MFSAWDFAQFMLFCLSFQSSYSVSFCNSHTISTIFIIILYIKHLCYWNSIGICSEEKNVDWCINTQYWFPILKVKTPSTHTLTTFPLRGPRGLSQLRGGVHPEPAHRRTNVQKQTSIHTSIHAYCPFTWEWGEHA